MVDSMVDENNAISGEFYESNNWFVHFQQGIKINAWTDSNLFGLHWSIAHTYQPSDSIYNVEIFVFRWCRNTKPAILDLKWEVVRLVVWMEIEK